MYGEQEAEAERPRDGEGEPCCDISCNVNRLLLCSIHKRNVREEGEDMERTGRWREGEGGSRKGKSGKAESSRKG